MTTYKKPSVVARNVPISYALAMTKLHSDIARMSDADLDAELAEVEACAKLLCSKIGLALRFEKRESESLAVPEYVPIQMFGDGDFVQVDAVLHRTKIADEDCIQRRKVHAFRMHDYKTAADLLAQCERLRDDSMLLEREDVVQSLLPPCCIDAKHAGGMMDRKLKEHKLASCHLLFAVLRGLSGCWIAVLPTAKPVQGSAGVEVMELLEGSLPEFRSREELELKMAMSCPEFKEVKL